MNLTQWAKNWPYTVNPFHDSTDIMWTPDTSEYRVNPQYRALAWSLDDYRVTSVSGGSIWFCKREKEAGE